MAPLSSQATLPLFVLRRGQTGERALGALRTDRRVELILGNDRRTTWVPAAQRAAAVLVTTSTDPIAALLYVVTAGVTGPVVVAAPRRFAALRRAVLGAGAVAFVSTPVSAADVSRLVKALTTQSTGLQVDAGSHLVLDPIGRVVRLNTKTVRLSQREFAVLHCLSGRGGRPVSAVDVLSYVWGDGTGRRQTREILDVYIFNLRKKLRRLGLSHAIRTIRSYGYALVPTGTASDREAN